MTRAFALALALAVAAGCPGTQGAGRYKRGPHLGGIPVDDKGHPVDEHGNPTSEPLPPPPELVHEDRTIDVVVSAATTEPPAAEVIAHLGALWVHAKGGDKVPAILLVPGASDVSKKGTRSGDGVSKYSKPVDVSLAWADAFAKRGAGVLTWDKRTCGPNDDAGCAKNPQDDVDAQGPGALSKDVDAACALVKNEPDFDGRIVLFAHAQAAQVALSSSCAKEAVAIVLLAPVPRAIDEVLVAALKERADRAEKGAKASKDAAAFEEANQLKNLAGTREAEFASMKAGKFAPTAKVQGATIAFWKGWMELTGKTAALVDTAAGSATVIVVLGEHDVQYGEKDRVRIRALAPSAYLEIKGADHHLLSDGKLLDDTVDEVGKALDRVLLPKG